MAKVEGGVVWVSIAAANCEQFSITCLTHLAGCRVFGKTPTFTPQIVANRQNPRIFAAYSLLHKGETDLICSHDRWAMYRPTKVNGAWKTRRGVHLDVNPWKYVHDGEFTGKRTLFENNLVTKRMGLRVCVAAAVVAARRI